MVPAHALETHTPRVLALKGALLLVWATVSFGACFFARDLQVMVLGWPLNYWIGSQGAILAFLGIVVVYAWVMNRIDSENTDRDQGN